MTEESAVVDGAKFGLGAKRENREQSPYCDACKDSVIVWRTEPSYDDLLVARSMKVTLLDHMRIAKCQSCEEDVLFMMPAKIEELAEKAKFFRDRGIMHVQARYVDATWHVERIADAPP